MDNLKKLTSKQLQDELEALQRALAQQQNPDPQVRLQREMQIYRIELEMHHRELRLSQQRLELAHDRYLELYDFAPVGYLTFNRDGTVVEANLQLARILGRERERIVGVPFSSWLDSHSAHLFQTHLEAVFQASGKVTVELSLQTLEGRREVHLISEAVGFKLAGTGYCRSSLIDVSRQKQTERALDIARRELDARVRERTAELMAANRALRAEIERRDRAKYGMTAGGE